MTITPTSGIKNITEFSFQISPSSINPIISWGDGTFSYSNNASHVYSSIGLYQVFSGSCSSTSSFYVSVYDGNFFTDKISVQANDASSIVSCPFSFTINLSSKDQINTVILYASGSKSSPRQEKRNFWSHLNPEWEFSFNDKPISQIEMVGSPVYSGTNILGYSSSSAVSFKDDMPGNLNLFFTVLKKESDIPLNSRVYSCLSHSVCAVTPDKLFITSDGINPINQIQWADKNIPFVISVGSSVNSCTNILHYVSANIVETQLTSDCSSVKTVYSIVSSDTTKDFDCFSNAGYFLSSVYYPSSSISSPTYQNNLNECKQNYDKLEFVQKNNFLKNISLTASVAVTYENLQKQKITIFFEEDAYIYNLSGQYIDLENYDPPFNLESKTTVRFYFVPLDNQTNTQIPTPPPPPPPGGIIQPVLIDFNLDIDDPFKFDRSFLYQRMLEALETNYLFNYNTNFTYYTDSSPSQYLIQSNWYEYGPINDPQTSTSAISLSVLQQGSFTQTDVLTGQSNYFDLLPYENRHEFFRKGEDYTVYDVLKNSLPFDVTQYSNFDSYLSAVVGENDSLGLIYDKIHNFSMDHSDLETCGYDVLPNKALMLDSNIDDFGLELPQELKRLFNFSTIPLQKLIGTRCVCNTNFVECDNCYATNVCRICKFDKRTNLGDVIKQDDYVSAGEIILFKETGGQTYNFLPIKSQNSDVYQLKELSSLPVNYGSPTNYCYYRWNNAPQNNPVQSIVNYNDSRNKLNPGLSSNNDWYADNGVIEEMFNFVLNKYLTN